VDCNEIRDILDAYAISATSREESDAIETHVADCVRCWEELTKAQRTAALLALSSPIVEAPEHLESRVMAEARRGLASIRSEQNVPFLQRLRFGWSAAAAGLGAASVAALAFAGFLQAQVNDLRDENNSLEASMAEAAVELQRKDQQIENVSETTSQIANLLGETTTVEMTPKDTADESMIIQYSWGEDHRSGAVKCHDVPPPPDGQVYQVWFSTGGSRYAAGSFIPQDGDCFVPIELPDEWTQEPVGVGVSIEDPEAVVDKPQDGWLAYAYLPRD
jgi:FtsZ-binding cell division protein ZapB